MRKVADWANLEELPLSLVLDKLEEHIDHVRFGVVCKNWRSIAKLNHQNHQFRISLVDNNNAITLVNPFKYSSIPPISLPPLKYLSMVTLSADPIISPNDYVVAAIYNFGDLAFKRASQPFWIHIANEFTIVDVVFYNGLLIAEGDGDTIISFKFNNPPCDDSNDRNFTYYEKRATTTHSVPVTGLVDFLKSLNGDIWMVRRYLSILYGKCSYRLDVHSAKLRVWKTAFFFVGEGDSISVSASCFSKFEKDSIYFIYDASLGISNVKDRMSDTIFTAFLRVDASFLGSTTISMELIGYSDLIVMVEYCCLPSI